MCISPEQKFHKFKQSRRENPKRKHDRKGNCFNYFNENICFYKEMTHNK